MQRYGCFTAGRAAGRLFSIVQWLIVNSPLFIVCRFRPQDKVTHFLFYDNLSGGESCIITRDCHPVR